MLVPRAVGKEEEQERRRLEDIQQPDKHQPGQRDPLASLVQQPHLPQEARSCSAELQRLQRYHYRHATAGAKRVLPKDSKVPVLLESVQEDGKAKVDLLLLLLRQVEVVVVADVVRVRPIRPIENCCCWCRCFRNSETA